MSLERLIGVLDAERDPYIEWHDGPSLIEVDNAIEGLGAEERIAASRIVAERIRSGYDPYLGRAAELLGTEECREALGGALGASPGGAAIRVAGNILALGKSEEAIALLKSIIENRSLHWSARIDALVSLKIALDAVSGGRPITDFITPELESVIYDAISDEDYLVRYHAAEALLKAAGVREPLSDHRELFRYICGTHAIDGPVDDADREGFRRAAEIIRAILRPDGRTGAGG